MVKHAMAVVLCSLFAGCSQKPPATVVESVRAEPASSAVGNSPAADVVATVLGHEITRTDCLSRAHGIGSVEIGIYSLVLGLLLEDFAASQKITLTQQEIDSLWATWKEVARRRNPDPSQPVPEPAFDEAETRGKLSEVQSNLAQPDLPMLERLAFQAQERSLTRGLESKSRATMVAYEQLWPLRRDDAVYKKYGGKVVARQISIHPSEAYLKLAREAEADGRLKFHDDALAQVFWQRLADDLNHTEVPPERVNFRLPLLLQSSGEGASAKESATANDSASLDSAGPPAGNARTH